MKTTEAINSCETSHGFRRRYYPCVRRYLSETGFLIRHSIKILKLYRHIPADFRERLMLTVTAVNQCHYCRNFHTILATYSGIDHSETARLNQGMDASIPANQLPALQYARAWAENGGDFSASAKETLKTHYENSTIEAIELAIRGIWIGNLSGNTWDYWLYRLSVGRFGQ